MADHRRHLQVTRGEGVGPRRSRAQNMEATELRAGPRKRLKQRGQAALRRAGAWQTRNRDNTAAAAGVTLHR